MNSNKFRIKQNISNNASEDAKANIFAEGAETNITVSLDVNEKPKQSFTVPLNSYELELLRKVSEKEDRSMRYMSRKLLVEEMKRFLAK